MPWTLTSHDKLVGAGYLFRCRLRCKHCNRDILLYGLPGNTGRAMSIEPHTFQPHRLHCTGGRREDPKQERLF